MEWSNEKVLEFIELFEMEPCLWNLKLKAHKSRIAAKDAWRRVLENLSYTISLDELKKKKESLMGYYRIHLNKYKNSLKAGNSDVYRTSWFAFDALDGFLRPLYEPNSSLVEVSLFIYFDVFTLI